MDPKLVKNLREMTGAGIMDCKTALVESNGDIDAAIEILRKKGVASAAKKVGRITKEGVIACKVSSNYGILAEINSETDFVARNDKFQQLATLISEVTFEKFKDKDITLENLLETHVKEGGTIHDEIVHHISVIGENISLRRIGVIRIQNGMVGSYIHRTISPGLGRIGVLVGIESSVVTPKLEQLARQIAMHIAAMNPDVISADELHHKNGEEATEALLDQSFVMDSKMTIGNMIIAYEKESGQKMKINSMLRYALGQ